MKKPSLLDFEKPIQNIEDKIEELIKLSSETGISLDDQISVLREQADVFKNELYLNLKPSQRIQISRHPKRPTFQNYVEMITDTFIELHGDRHGTDDRAIIGGVAQIDGRSVVIIGTQKGNNTRENLEHNFGMPHPEGYRKALRLFYHADKFNMPIITIVDTPGAYPGIKAEQTGQGEAIAFNLREMTNLSVPFISIVTGEGCSGGALGLAVANHVYILEHAYYTVISPEGCASILFRDALKAKEAAEALKITAEDLLKLKIVDGVIKEPLGGAHNDPECMARSMKNTIKHSLNELDKLSKEELKKNRYNKFRKMGEFIE
ncbi:MAG: acetyl-CoA carboxylase carboxyltransferase subunit alpha [Vampirovibrionia bacterium]